MTIIHHKAVYYLPLGWLWAPKKGGGHVWGLSFLCWTLTNGVER